MRRDLAALQEEGYVLFYCVDGFVDVDQAMSGGTLIILRAQVHCSHNAYKRPTATNEGRSRESECVGRPKWAFRGSASTNSYYPPELTGGLSITKCSSSFRIIRGKMQLTKLVKVSKLVLIQNFMESRIWQFGHDNFSFSFIANVFLHLILSFM